MNTFGWFDLIERKIFDKFTFSALLSLRTYKGLRHWQIIAVLEETISNGEMG